MVHRRERRVKLKERRIRKVIFSRAFHDREKSDMVSRVSRLDIVSLLGEPVESGSIPDVEVGEILVDARGTGSFQRIC